MAGNLSHQEVRRGRLHRWLQTAAFLGAAAILGMVLYTSFAVQSNRRAAEATVTAAVRARTAAAAVSRPAAAVSETPVTLNREAYASTPLPTSLQPISVDSAARVEEVARWGRGLLNSVAWSPDGSTLAVGSSLGAYLYEAETLEAITLLYVGGGVGPVAFSADGQLMAMALSKGLVQLWSVVDGTLLQIVEGVGSNVAVTFSPAGQLLLAWMSQGDTAPLLWRDGVMMPLRLPHDAEIGGVIVPLDDASAGRGTIVAPTAVALSPDGRYVAVGLSDGNIHLWQVSDGGYVTTIATELVRVEQMVFSPNGRLLAVTSADPGVWVWQVADGALLHRLDEGLRLPLSLAFSPDGRTLAAVGNQVASFYGVDSGALVRTIEIPADMGPVIASASATLSFSPRAAFSPDGQSLALGPAVGPLTLLQMEAGLLRRSEPAFTLPWCGLALSPDGGTVAVRTFLDDGIWLWDVARAVPLHVLPAPAGCGLGVTSFSPDGRFLAVGSGETVSLWRVDGTVARQLGPYPEDLMHCAVYSPDGRWVAAISSEGQVHLWEQPAGELRVMATMTSTAASSLCSLAFAPGGQYLATSGLGSPVSLWAIPAGTLVRRWDVSQGEAMGGFVFSPDGQLLAAWTAPQEISLWPVAGGPVVYTLTVPTEAGLDLVFSPDGSILAGSSVEGPIYLWRVSDGTLLRVLEGHNSWVGGLAFSPDERLLFSASGDGTLRVWGVR